MTPNLEATPPEWLINFQPEIPKGRRFGKPTITNQTEIFPTGEKLIDAARSAIWDAWQMGLQKDGNTVYPRLPLLDKEPMEPGI